MTNEDNPAVLEAKNFRLLVWALVILVSCGFVAATGYAISVVVEAARTPAESMPSYIQYKQKVEAIKAILNK